jgi:hypothetical protein
MPFTVSHAIAIVPIAHWTRGALPFSALFIGSMTPDFALFCPLPINYDRLHSLHGIFLYDVPIGLVGFIVFQLLLKPFLFAIAPRPLQARLLTHQKSCLNRSTRFWIAVVVAIAAGSATHVTWDAFTHFNCFFTNRIDWLQQTWTMGPITWPAYHWMQQASSVIGLAALLGTAIWFIARGPPAAAQPQTADKDLPAKAAAWFLLIVPPPAFSALRASMAESTSEQVFLFITSLLSATVIVAVALAATLKLAILADRNPQS